MPADPQAATKDKRALTSTRLPPIKCWLRKSGASSADPRTAVPARPAVVASMNNIPATLAVLCIAFISYLL